MAERDPKLDTDDVIVTRPFCGLLYMQVCAYAEVPPGRVQDRANELNPAGTTNGWRLILDGDPDHAGRAPVKCLDDPARLHYMLVC